MWNIFKLKNQNAGEDINKPNRDKIIPAIEDFYREFKIQINQSLLQYLSNVQEIQESLSKNYNIPKKQQILIKTFDDLMSALEGLLSVIQQMRKQYSEFQGKIQEYQKYKSMLANHHDIVSNLQETHAQQISEFYQEKNILDKEMNTKIEQLKKENQDLTQEKIELIKQLNHEKQHKNDYENKLNTLTQQLSRTFQENEDLNKKLNNILQLESMKSSQRTKALSKSIDMSNLRLQNIYIYAKIRNMINKYLDIEDLCRLKCTSKFYKFVIQREESQIIMDITLRKNNRKVLLAEKNIKNYQKIYQLFPDQNLKSNALKYLYFKIKPGTYILPFLQEDYEQEVKEEESTKQKNQKEKFSWRKMFKNQFVSNNKKQTVNNKFSISQLKNQSQFKIIEGKISDFFGSLFSLKMPEDLQYFEETMERQLEDLKQNLKEHKKQKITLTEWASQLVCLTKFLFLQTSQLNNLLLVVFGELISKNRQLISIKERFEQLKDNQAVLRNLIENISQDKRQVEKKIFFIENQIIKQKLQKESLQYKYENILSENKTLNQKIIKLQDQNLDIKLQYQKNIDEKKKTDVLLSKVKEQLQKMEFNTSKSRKESFNSAQLNEKQQEI